MISKISFQIQFVFFLQFGGDDETDAFKDT